MKRMSCVVKAVVTRPAIKESTVPVPSVLEGKAMERARAFLDVLRKNHIAIAELLPLQREVNKVLHPMYPTIPHKIINSALYFHTSSIGYIENIYKGFGRFTVDKIFVESISDEDREKATVLLKQIKTKLFKQAMKEKKLMSSEKKLDGARAAKYHKDRGKYN